MKLIGIANKHKSREPMNVLTTANISEESGVENDLRGRSKKRQVTLLSAQQWSQACDDVSHSLPWTTRRANLLIDGIIFTPDMVGNRVRIGEMELKITGETDPCHLMDKQYPGLKDALSPQWRGGVTCKVICSGHVKVGDTVIIEKE